ncbi:MAG: TldD/PmbA family protein [Nitrospirae bacterium]|nr:TldD/PmbA family protein [Nitrospirota bacterium]
MQALEEGAIERILETILIESRRLKARQWEAYVAHLAEQSIEVKGQEIHARDRAETTTLGVRLLLDGRMGFSYATQLTPDAVRRALQFAAGTARCLDADEHHAFPKSTPAPLPAVNLYDAHVPSTPDEEKIKLALELEASSLRAHRAVKRVRKSAYDEIFGTVYLANSNGLQSSYSKTYCSLSLMAVAEKGGESENAWDFQFSSFLHELDAEALGKKVARKAVSRLGGRVPKTRECPVVLENHVAAEFLSLLAPSFLVENTMKKKSLWGDAVGRLILSKHLTLVDNGLETRGANAAPFDGEGVPAQRSTVVERGLLRTLLCDTYWGNKSRRGSTGNARRGASQSAPVLAPSNLHVEAGTWSPDRLHSECGSGVLITEVIGLHTADPISGEFSLGAVGQEIAKGKPAGPLRGFGIAGNLKTLFKHVDAVANDLRFMGSIGSPSLLVSNLQISGN